MFSTGRLTIGLCVVLCAPRAVAENWPQWRGPEATGVSREENLPTRWTSEDNVAWKAPLDGLGTSTPVVWGDRIFITSQAGTGPVDRRGAEFPDAPSARDYGTDTPVRFLVYAFRRSDGHLLWRYEFAAEGDLPAVHYKHSLASPSAVTDGESVYAWVGTGQLVALSMEGELLWQRHLGREYAPFDVLWGHGSSPVLYDNFLYLLCDHPARAYLLALDKWTGKETWKVERGSGLRSYSTPFVLRSPAGDELIVNSSHRVESFDPKTGALLWYAGEPTTLAIPMPVSHGGILYASRGYASGPYASIRGGGRGDVSASHVRWSIPTGAPYVSSLLYYEGLVYMANEHGIVTAIDSDTGAAVWRERLGGVFTASPVAADGRIYFLEESGKTVVLEAGRTFRIVAENALGERSLASPAVSNGQIFIRTDRHLYCIGRPAQRKGALLRRCVGMAPVSVWSVWEDGSRVDGLSPAREPCQRGRCRPALRVALGASRPGPAGRPGILLGDGGLPGSLRLHADPLWLRNGRMGVPLGRRPLGSRLSASGSTPLTDHRGAYDHQSSPGRHECLRAR